MRAMIEPGWVGKGGWDTRTPESPKPHSIIVEESDDHVVLYSVQDGILYRHVNKEPVGFIK